jgi:hypothetical protein
VYHLLPALALLQFPWRWLLVVSLVSALAPLVCARVWLGSRAQRFAWALPPLALALSIPAASWAAHRLAQPCDDEDNVRAQLQLPPPAGPGFEGTDEYTAAGADTSEIQQGLPPVRLLGRPDADEGDSTTTPNPPWHAQPASPVQIEQWTPEHVRFRVPARHPLYAVVRRMRYPAWLATVNGQPAHLVPREDGLLTLLLPPGDATVDVRWHTTADVLAGRTVSLLACVAWLLLAIRARRTEPREGQL